MMKRTFLVIVIAVAFFTVLAEQSLAFKAIQRQHTWEDLVSIAGNQDPAKNDIFRIYVIDDHTRPCDPPEPNKYNVRFRKYTGAAAFEWLKNKGMAISANGRWKKTARYNDWEFSRNNGTLYWQYCGKGNNATRFDWPKVGGLALDWCFTYGHGCGQQAADAFCKQKGFSNASSFDGYDTTPNKTYIIGSGKNCEGAHCGTFKSIDCSN